MLYPGGGKGREKDFVFEQFKLEVLNRGGSDGKVLGGDELDFGVRQGVDEYISYYMRLTKRLNKYRIRYLYGLYPKLEFF